MRKSIRHTIKIALAVICIGFLRSSVPYAQAANTQENRDYKYAAGLYAEGMYDMAIKELDRFIAAYPQSLQMTNARFLVAGSHFYQKRFEKTIELTRRIQKESPSSPIMDAVIFLEGRAFFQLGRYKEAISSFNGMLSRFPKSEHIAEALYNVAESHYNLKNMKQAAEIDRKSVV